ncbi:hypothetical protein [Salidesulfovibrio onnuriiensis]|uniref:hypothetical protein n=1 Tax=Salidesulfovibrio onnuriiensis TaxID=2583823 RepID=UPI0011C90DD3|nr:hypothetical protein [Salidesulfovibrio onnuriiensis]
MRTYYTNLKNKTDRTWTMVIYGQVPGSDNTPPLAWKTATVLPGERGGVQWQTSYDVTVAAPHKGDNRSFYAASQTLETELGQEWEIVFKDGVQQLRRIGALRPDRGDHIVIHNNSGLAANPGVGMSGRTAVCKRDIPANASTQFKLPFTCYAALFRDAEPGEIIGRDVEVGPLELQFGKKNNVADIIATGTGDCVTMQCAYTSR